MDWLMICGIALMLLLALCGYACAVVGGRADKEWHDD
jgi:hypothetical protein